VQSNAKSLDLRRFANMAELTVEMTPRLKTLDLAGLLRLENVYVRRAPALVDIRGLPASLVNLDIDEADALRSLCVAGLPRLDFLYYGNSTGLRQCELPASLRGLELNPPSELAPVRYDHLTQLTLLRMASAQKVLGSLPASLVELSADYTDDCEPLLRGLTGLRSLELYCDGLEDLPALSHLQLETLTLHGYAGSLDTPAGLLASVTTLCLYHWRGRPGALSALVGGPELPPLAPKLAELYIVHGYGWRPGSADAAALRALRDRGVRVS
jgi:hypothetical protein